MRRTPALALAAATLLLTAACSSSEPPADAAPAATPEATTVADEAPALEECLLGTWEQDVSSAAEQMDQMMASNAQGTEVTDLSFDGTSSTTFHEDGTLTTEADGGSRIVTVIDGAEMVMTTTSSGTSTGLWTLDGDALTISDLDTSGLEATLVTTIDGVEVEIPGMEGMGDIAGLAAEAPPTATTITCTQDELTTSLEMPDPTMEPVVTRYTR